MSDNPTSGLGGMSCKTAVIAAVAGGYLLGRTKKLKLALTLGSVLAGRRLGLDPQELINKGIQKVTELPQVGQLGDQVRDQLVTAARTAVTEVVNRKVGSLTDALSERTGKMAGRTETKDEEPEDEEPEEESEEPEESEGEGEPEEGAEEPGDEVEQEEGEREEEPDRRAQRRAKRARGHEPSRPEGSARRAAVKRSAGRPGRGR